MPMGGCGGSHIGSICISIIILIIVIILLILIGFNMNANQQSQQFNKSGFEIFQTSSGEPVETCLNADGNQLSECTTGATVNKDLFTVGLTDTAGYPAGTCFTASGEAEACDTVSSNGTGGYTVTNNNSNGAGSNLQGATRDN